jgi:putative acetyltransferase
MTIRKYRPGEEREIWRLYHDTTHRINGRHYTQDQVQRWAPEEPDWDEWKARLILKNPFVAEHEGRILGFAELEHHGFIDRFYTHHEKQREGIGTLLYRALETEAKRLKMVSLHAEVSTTAKAFFLRMGFEVVEEQNNLVCGKVATNYRMRKSLVE